MNTVIGKVRSTLIRETMSTFKDCEILDYVLVERLDQLENALALAVSNDDAWALALACVNMWMPNPSRSGEMEYNSTTYNTVEIFCLCVLHAYGERE